MNKIISAFNGKIQFFVRFGIDCLFFAGIDSVNYMVNYTILYPINKFDFRRYDNRSLARTGILYNERRTI